MHNTPEADLNNFLFVMVNFDILERLREVRSKEEECKRGREM